MHVQQRNREAILDLWPEDRKAMLDLVNESIGCDALTPVEEEDVLRCIKVGLLCTVNRAECRPTMPRVIKLLEGETSVVLQEIRKLNIPQTMTWLDCSSDC